jgi:DNA-binding NtrC family response regulator
MPSCPKYRHAGNTTAAAGTQEKKPRPVPYSRRFPENGSNLNNFNNYLMSVTPGFTILICTQGQGCPNHETELQTRHACRILNADNTAQAMAVLDNEHIDLVLLVMNQAEMDVMAFLKKTFAVRPGPKVMLFGSLDEMSGTLQSIKTVPPEHTGHVLASCFHNKDLKNSRRLQPVNGNTVSSQSGIMPFRYEGLVGDTPPMQKLKELIVKIAPTNTTVLLQGESGTGKEAIARAIHYHSLRRNEIFMPVDCAAINETVIESELFGHTKGAFTGADQHTLGLIRSADKGTLFLDEIAELSLNLQAKLLRTLQERTVKPVGSSRMFPVDIRIIAATNRNLAEAVKNGTFRQDLYYRLNTVTIYAPPLREHLSDIPLLCSYFTKKLSNEGFVEKTLSVNALVALRGLEWPGNVRELENVIRSAVTLSACNNIEAEDLTLSGCLLADETQQNLPETSSIAAYERKAIRKTLDQTLGNRREAAKILGISEATLYRRIKLYNI